MGSNANRGIYNIVHTFYFQDECKCKIGFREVVCQAHLFINALILTKEKEIDQYNILGFVNVRQCFNCLVLNFSIHQWL